MKRVTVFHANGETKEYQAPWVTDIAEMMQPGEYGYVWHRNCWMLRGRDDQLCEEGLVNFRYVKRETVPEEFIMKWILLQ